MVKTRRAAANTDAATVGLDATQARRGNPASSPHEVPRDPPGIGFLALPTASDSQPEKGAPPLVGGSPSTTSGEPRNLPIDALPGPSGISAMALPMSTDSRPLGEYPPVGVPLTTSVSRPGDRQSTSTRPRHSHSSRSSKSQTVVAQTLAAEAEHRRRNFQRQKELARLEQEAEEAELRAKLAAIEADKSCSRSPSLSCNSNDRVATWVHNQNQGEPGFMANPPAVQAPCVLADAAANPCVLPADPTHQAPAPIASPQEPDDAISKLAQAIVKLQERPKIKDLPPFSGQISTWMAFKANYDRTKNKFSSAENLTRLNLAVRGAAQEAVASLLWRSCDPEEVMRALEQTYARPELIVAHEIAGLKNLNKISDAESLNALANRLRNCVASIKLLNQREYLYSPELFRSVLLKLSEHTRARFTDFASTQLPIDQAIPISKLELLSEFLLCEADRQLKYNFTMDVVASLPTTKAAQSYKPTTKVNAHATATHNKDSNDNTQCTFCNQGQHSIQKCKAFQLLTVDNRWRWTKDSKVCYRCLKSTPHKWNTCRAKRCGVDGCPRRHHALLHGNSGTSTVANPPLPEAVNNNTALPHQNELVVAGTSASTDVKVTNTFDNSFNILGSSKLEPRSHGLLKMLPVVLEGPSGEYNTYALLDEGSTATLIDGDVAARIGAESTGQERIRIDGVGGMSKTVDVSYVNFLIRGRNMPDRFLIENARAIIPLSLSSQSTTINFADYEHLADLSDILSYDNAQPTVLIGAGDWHLLTSHDMRVGNKSDPVASRTPLGWVLHGCISSSMKALNCVNYTLDSNSNSPTSRKLDELELLIKQQYEIDSLGIAKTSPRCNTDDQRAVSLVDTSARRLCTGRFEVGLPWKKDVNDSVPDSYPQAVLRLKSLEKQMSKDETFANAYKKFVSDIISKGYAEECDPSTYHGSSTQNIRWYLPHFGVFHPQKKKLRVVHDAAAVTKGVSLNNMLLQGPDLLQSLLDILFRFREGPIAFNADIREMFPQIKIRESDRDAQRFLWRDSNMYPIKEYRMSSMIFGAVSSPFIALHIENKNAKEFESKYPAAAHAIIHNHYMDDFIGSEFNVSDAAELASDIVTVHKACCFEMRSWISNVPEALALVPKELRSDSCSDVTLLLDHDVGALGVKWNPLNDTLGFRTGSNEKVVTLTKRSLLSCVMSVYDPLGLLMPIVIQGRILIQKLWREGVKWDEPIIDKYESECKDWFDQLATAAHIRIPRWYLGRSDPTDIQLHVFADGGEQAYACVAYWRFTFNDDTVSLALIGSKARVAPLKPLSIPRLELQAALIATRLAQTILNAHRLTPSAVHYWTDSTTVLNWIRSDARNYKAFVAHRLGEILKTTNPSNWKWVPSALNIADDATKRKHLNLVPSHRWFSGPSFLLQSSEEWPKEPTNCYNEDTSELKSEHVGLLVDVPVPNPPVPDVSRFSSWQRLLRATARVIQGVRCFRSLSRTTTQNSNIVHSTTSPSQLSVADLLQAEKLLLQRAQVDSFSEEFKALKTAQPVPKSSKIASLAPVLDDDDLIRLDSRIKSAPGVTANVASPVILDSRHHIIRLLIYHYHTKANHAFDELVLNEMRQKYWILRARPAIRNVAKACLKCRRQKATLTTPRTGDLPPERLDHHKRPFTHVGLDYFGPVDVSVGRRREKRYVALYTCLVTRAVHLEVVASLTTASAIMSLRRLIARRGSPSTIFSDNGKNFVGASRELAELYDESVEDIATDNKIKWKFIPPLSPFMGGAWERLVRTIKTALKATLKERSPKEEIFTTLLLEAESIVNSRPLTYVPSSSDAPEAITPFHFILGTSSVSPWLSTLSDSDLLRRCDWRRTLRLADHFWARWLREYLPTLRPRGANTSAPNVSEGDVVLIGDSALPRGRWPLGRVTKVYRGADGLIRVADVFTKGGTLRRPVRKLLPIVAEPQAVTTTS